MGRPPHYVGMLVRIIHRDIRPNKNLFVFYNTIHGKDDHRELNWVAIPPNPNHELLSELKVGCSYYMKLAIQDDVSKMLLAQEVTLGEIFSPRVINRCRKD